MSALIIYALVARIERIHHSHELGPNFVLLVRVKSFSTQVLD